MPDYDIHGNDMNRDIHGNSMDRNIHGNRPSDIQGNPWEGRPLVGSPSYGGESSSGGSFWPSSGGGSGGWIQGGSAGGSGDKLLGFLVLGGLCFWALYWIARSFLPMFVSDVIFLVGFGLGGLVVGAVVLVALLKLLWRALLVAVAIVVFTTLGILALNVYMWIQG